MKKNKYLEKIFKNNNSLSVSRFSYLCLYKKEIGYYQKYKIGRDFVTSPEVSQMFGECISIFILSILNSFKEINFFCELGPGNCTLSKDLTKNLSNFIKKNITYFLYEKSENINLSVLKKNSKTIEFLKLNKLNLPKEPVFFIANEFLDALPINQFEMNNDIIYERRIILSENKLKIILKKNFYLPPGLKNLKNGEVFEYSPLCNLYLKKIFSHIRKFGGGILIFDYGPFKKTNKSTIQAIHQKEKIDFLKFPFESDITHHVDFQIIKTLSLKFSLKTYGPITQKKFLYFNGINERMITLLKNKSLKNKELLHSQFRRLTDPDGMGDLIKCIFVTRDDLNINYFNNE